MSRRERAARALGAAVVFVALADLLFALDPMEATLWPLWLYGALATLAVAVAFAAPGVDLRACIANGLAAIAALPLYVQLSCSCQVSRFGSPLPPGAALFAYARFVALPGLATLTVTLWWIARRFKHGDLWEPKQW